MAASKQATPEQQWRDKYLALNEKHEQMRQQIGDRNEQLRRALVMVSLLAEGNSAPLDEKLHDVREGMRSSTLGFTSKVSDLESAIRLYEKQFEHNSEGLAKQLVAAADALLKCDLPKELISQIKQLRKDAPKALGHWQGYASQLQGWSDVLSTLADYGQGGDGPSWLQKLFKRSDANADVQADSPTTVQSKPTDEPALNSTEHQADQAQTLKSSTAPLTAPAPTPANPNGTNVGQGEPEPGFSRIAGDVAETLIGLMERLVIPERLESRSEQLQQRMNSGLHWYEFVDVLEDTSQFLLDCLGSGQEEFERFLQSLDKRLQAIQLMVTDANSSQANREQAREDLETMVRDQIADIRSVVNGLGDLGELGSSIRDHLTTIVKAMEHYQELESQREERLAEQLQVLQARLGEMEAEASQARQIIEDQKTRATQDHLTGLPNRAAYDVRLSEELLKRSRGGRSLALIIGDVDHFKRINDTYGHMAGDKVLQLISATLRKHLRKDDFIARFGGEEFVVLLPATDSDGAMKVADHLRASIEACPFNFRGERVSITMSFGVSEFRALEAPETVFERADQALYQSKETGRNRCTCG